MQTPPRHTGVFRRALALTGLLTLAAFAAMSAVLAIGLARADDLFEAVGRSQDQLAQVTRIQADVNRLLNAWKLENGY